MKTNCLMFCMLIIHIVSNGQILDEMQREYGYDAAGNRILRKVVEIPQQKSLISNIDSVQEIAQDSNKKQEKYYVDNLGNFSLKVFPNPATSVVNIDILNTNTRIEGNIMVYNASGALLTTKQINTSHIELDVSPYSKGNYFAVIYINGEKTHWKIIKN
ncbi:MAG: T9SS type A sorting domain-containing protein [Bacteroidales bacterium]